MVVGLSRGNLWATQTKKLQRLAIELHIPLLFGYDVFTIPDDLPHPSGIG